MTINPVILVAGLGRCGLTLMMQMLDAGRFPVLGKFPDYEEVGPSIRNSAKIIATCQGMAVKIVAPGDHCFHAAHYKAIVLTRNHKVQAASQLRFMSLMLPNVPQGRAARTAMAGSIKKDERAMLKDMKKLTDGPMLHLTFEGLLRTPDTALAAIEQLLGQPVNRMAAKAQIRPRSSAMVATPIELELIEAGGLLP